MFSHYARWLHFFPGKSIVWKSTDAFSWCFPTSNNELTLVLHSCSFVAGNASVVAIVVRCQVVDSQRAGEVDVVNGHTQAGGNWPSIFLPCDVQWPVSWHDHAGDEDPLTNGETLKFKGLDVGRDCRQKERQKKTKYSFSLKLQRPLQLPGFSGKYFLIWFMVFLQSLSYLSLKRTLEE